jgi:hypothetical protein
MQRVTPGSKLCLIHLVIFLVAMLCSGKTCAESLPGVSPDQPKYETKRNPNRSPVCELLFDFMPYTRLRALFLACPASWS